MPLPPITDPSWPSIDLFAVTPNDTTPLATVARQLYVGTGGDVTVTTDQGSTVTFKAVYSGTILGPFYVKYVKATNTTASNIVAFV